MSRAGIGSPGRSSRPGVTSPPPPPSSSPSSPSSRHSRSQSRPLPTRGFRPSLLFLLSVLVSVFCIFVSAVAADLLPTSGASYSSSSPSSSSSNTNHRHQTGYDAGKTFISFPSLNSIFSSLFSSPSSSPSPAVVSPSPGHDSAFVASMKTPTEFSSASLRAIWALVRAWLWAQVSTSAALWRTLAIIFAAANFKNLPFVWHARVFGTMFYHMYFNKNYVPPRALFAPAISVSRTPLTEIDWNIHKSNSTYYSDLDVARTHLVTNILRRGMLFKNRYVSHRRARNAVRKKEGLPPLPAFALPIRVPVPPTDAELMNALARESAAASAGCPFSSRVAEATLGERRMTYEMLEVPGRHAFALGGTATFFYREIPPLVAVEFWTRISCWDRKWLYVVTHIVKKGQWTRSLGRQGKWILQPWRNSGAKKLPESTATAAVDQLDKVAPLRPSGLTSAADPAAAADAPVPDVGPIPASAVPVDHPSSDFQQKANEMYAKSVEFKLAQSIYATSVSRYVIKKGKVTVPPEIVLRRGDMLPDKPDWAPVSFELPDGDQVRETVQKYLDQQRDEQKNAGGGQQSGLNGAPGRSSESGTSRSSDTRTSSSSSSTSPSSSDESNLAPTLDSVPTSPTGTSTPSCSSSTPRSFSKHNIRSLSPSAIAEIYVRVTKQAWLSQTESERAAEIARKEKLEPGKDVDDPGYIVPVPKSVIEADGDQYLGWDEVERRRVAGLLAIGDSFAKLDSGLAKAFRGDMEKEGVLGMYWDF